MPIVTNFANTNECRLSKIVCVFLDAIAQSFLSTSRQIRGKPLNRSVNRPLQQKKNKAMAEEGTLAILDEAVKLFFIPRGFIAPLRDLSVAE